MLYFILRFRRNQLLSGEAPTSCTRCYLLFPYNIFYTYSKLQSTIFLLLLPSTVELKEQRAHENITVTPSCFCKHLLLGLGFFFY